MADYEEIVKKYRQIPIEGKCMDLVPLRENMLEEVVELRNQKRSLYFFNQGYKLTLEDQKKWFAFYLERKDDIYWGIVSKQGKMIGTIRLYDITDDFCDHGSFIIDESKSTEAPYALETMLMTLKFAFEVLKVALVVNDDRVDNKMMNSISKRVGFKYIKDINIRGAAYHHYELIPSDFKKEKLESMLEAWFSR